MKANVRVVQYNDGETVFDTIEEMEFGTPEFWTKIVEAIKNWKCMWEDSFELSFISTDLDTAPHAILKLTTTCGDEYELWEIV